VVSLVIERRTARVHGVPVKAGDADRVDDDPDTDLRRALLADLDAGFADVVYTHEQVVYAVALRLTRIPADAEDLAAEAFLRAYRALRGYDAPRIQALRLRPWLLTILRNTARNAMRDARRQPAPPPVFEPVEEAFGGPSVEQHLEQQQLQDALGELLAELSEIQRTAVVLRHVVGLPTAEVAEVLGCPVGTAKSHISRGLARLREMLATRTAASGGEESWS
jgi:RNA polymerase sigma factor (sigma-70 family)